MATERQIAANRRNARNSGGPRSRAGKKRASRNSCRHGLAAAAMPTEEDAERVEKLARRIAGNTADLATLEHARNAAEAEFELARVRKVKAALIEGMFAFGAPEVPQLSILCDFGSQAKWVLDALGRGKKDAPQADEPATRSSGVATMPSAESDRIAEAVRRALPELVKLDRYERHAVRQRDRSLRAILESRNRYP